MPAHDELSKARASGFLTVRGVRIEIAWHGPLPTGGPSLVFLHEGLGCVGMWRDFPTKLVERLGMGGLVYSRAGYGRSDRIELPRPLDYMQREGIDSLPALLDTLGIDDAILFGHSDGASIALVHAGTPSGKGRVKALVLEAPHVLTEDVAVASIARAREAFEHGDLRERLARHHGANVDCAFWGWNRAWLDPGFRAWNIESFVREVEAPMLLIQGEDDEYGTLAQLDAIERQSHGDVERLVLPRSGHSPHRSVPEAVLEATERFVRSL